MKKYFVFSALISISFLYGISNVAGNLLLPYNYSLIEKKFFYAQDQEKINFSLPETWILGYFSPERFTRQPHSQWYNQGYDSYEFDNGTIRKLLDMDLSDVSILVIMGTWCSDSRREVPRFMKILTAINFNFENVKFIGVDNTKFAPIDIFESLDIERVPTFIFFRKNIEVGRIIENPVTSLEQDMLKIFTEKN